MVWVGVGMGSNIEPERHIRAGLLQLNQRFGPLTVSTVYANAAVGFAGADFLNLVASFETALPASTVATALRDIESSYQQRRTGGMKLTSRALDLDLLLYGDAVLHENGVRVPRDEIVRYAFVLRPLAEIAGKRRHPVLGLTFTELWAGFDQSREILTPVTLPW